MRGDPVELECQEVMYETDMAILCVIDGEEVWVPKSVIDDDSEVFSKKSATESTRLIVKAWWARKQGLAE